MLTATDKAELNLHERELAEWMKQGFAVVVGPDDFKATVASLLYGGNFRELSERCLRAYLPCYLSWLTQICYEAKVASGGAENWRQQLLSMVSEIARTAAPRQKVKDQTQAARPTRQQLARELEVILLGLTRKTAINLDIGSASQIRLAEYIGYVNDVYSLHPWGDNLIALNMMPVIDGGTLTLTAGDSNSVGFNGEETIWFLQAAGAITLMLRGRFKSLLGKQLEGATLVTMLQLLGLKRLAHGKQPTEAGFALNVELKNTGSRETDAVVYAPPTPDYPNGMTINIDMGLIGAGNQEVTQDKLSRVGTYGVVVVDKLGVKSKVPAAAISMKVALIQLRSSIKDAPIPEPLQDLYLHLNRFFPGTLVKPPRGKEQILVTMGELEQDKDYGLLFSRLYAQFASVAQQIIGSEAEAGS